MGAALAEGGLLTCAHPGASGHLFRAGVSITLTGSTDGPAPALLMNARPIDSALCAESGEPVSIPLCVWGGASQPPQFWWLLSEAKRTFQGSWRGS